MTDKLYTPENCNLVGEWIGVGPEFCDQVSMQRNAAIPELIREALANEGVSVDQWVNPMVGSFISLHKLGSGIIVKLRWNTDKSPTARHALFAATVEYLEVK